MSALGRSIAGARRFRTVADGFAPGADRAARDHGESAAGAAAGSPAIEVEFNGEAAGANPGLDAGGVGGGRGQGAVAAMIPVPSGVRVWLAVGHTDMRRGMNSLALQVQEGLGRDPHAGDLYVFRGKRGHLIKNSLA